MLTLSSNVFTPDFWKNLASPSPSPSASPPRLSVPHRLLFTGHPLAHYACSKSSCASSPNYQNSTCVAGPSHSTCIPTRIDVEAPRMNSSSDRKSNNRFICFIKLKYSRGYKWLTNDFIFLICVGTTRKGSRSPFQRCCQPEFQITKNH